MNLKDNILHIFYCSLLPKMGINRNIPTVLTLIPFYMGGFQLKALEVEQCIKLIGAIICCFNSLLLTANLIKHSLEYLQLEMGWDSPIFLS